MKTLGLIGGMSWELTAIYYRLINELVRERLGGVHSAKLLAVVVRFLRRCRAPTCGRLGRRHGDDDRCGPQA